MDSAEAHQQVYCQLKNFYGINKSIPEPWHFIFSSLYAIISVFAFLCNSLLLISLQSHNKRKSKRTGSLSRLTRCLSRHIRSRRSKLSEKTRDHLIGYLAFFDLLLSLTMPFTGLDVLTKYWPLGPNSELLGQFTRAIPTAVVYSSSMIIILIAVNCYRQILHSSKKQLTPRKLRYIVTVIIIISIFFSTPIFYYTKLDPLFEGGFESYVEELNTSEYIFTNISKPQEVGTNVQAGSDAWYQSTTPPSSLSSGNSSEISSLACDNNIDDNFFSYITFLLDDWPAAADLTQTVRLYYSIFSLFTQLVIPFFVISFSYYNVYKRLKRQAKIQSRVSRTEENVKKTNDRNKRRNKLLATISLVYLITWLPLGIFGTLSDANINIFGDNAEVTTMIFMICHLIGMSSACANPIIYGYRNKHVRKGKMKLFYMIEI